MKKDLLPSRDVDNKGFYLIPVMNEIRSVKKELRTPTIRELNRGDVLESLEAFFEGNTDNCYCD